MEMIESKNWDGVDMTLVYKGTNKAVLKGDTVKDFRGDEAVIKGGRAPHKPSSQGKVWSDAFGQEFYASVYNLEWVES